VGREGELAQLHRYWAKASDGARQIVFVSGEPGIGKTALVDAFVESLHGRPEVRTATGQCVEQYGVGEAYLPLLEVVARLCRGPSRDRRIEALKRYAPNLLLQLPGLLDPADHAALQKRVQETSRERMLRELAQAAELFTVQRGLVIVLEDLHWSDVATLDWLRYTAQRREPAKLMIIGTYRPADVLASNHPLRAVVLELQARQQCEEISLSPLDVVAITEYLSKRFGQLSVPDVLTTTLVRRTGGNPLFLVNTVHLVEHAIVTDEMGSWTLAANKLQEVGGDIPDTLRQLIEHQLQRLSEEDQHALEVASVVGVEFSVAEVAAGLSGNIEALETECERLAHAGQFLRAQGVEEWPDGTFSGRYSFTHAMYQEVTATRVGGPRRIQLQRRIAERKEAAYGDRTREVAAELAVHFEHGRDYAKAVQYRRQAGEAAARSGAPQDALLHFKRGLELLTSLPDTPERIPHEVRLQLALTNPLYAIGGKTSLNEMENAHLRAYELCQRLGEPPQLASVLFGLGMVYELRGDLHRASELVGQLLALAQKSQNPALLLRAYMALGNGSYFLGEFATSLRYLEQGLIVYDPGKHSPHVSNLAQDLGVVCRSRAGWVLWCLGYPDQARLSCEKGLALARELSHDLSEAFALDGAIGVAQECGHVSIVEQRVTRLLTLSHEQGFAYPYAWGHMVRGWLLARQGKAEEGITQLREGLTAIRAGGQELGIPYFMALLADACGIAGHSEEGLAVVSEVLMVGQRSGERFYDAELYRLQGELFLVGAGGWGLGASSLSPRVPSLKPPASSGVAEEVEGAFCKALDIARDQQAKSLELRAAMSLARLWQGQGKRDDARALLQEVYDWFTEGFDTQDLQEAKALLVTLGGVSDSQKSKVQSPKESGARDWGLGTGPSSPQAPSPKPQVPLVLPQLPTPNPQPLTPSLVGREAQLAFLQDHLTTARSGVRQAVFLSGEPGIGKTALVDAFLSEVKTSLVSSVQHPAFQKTDLWLAHGQCVEQYGAGEAYLPVLEALGRLGREQRKEEVAAVLAQYAPTWLAQLPALIPAAKREELQRALATATRVRMLRELAEALEVLSTQRLLVLVLEDLHWSDPSTVELLAYLLRRQGQAQLLIIGTYRPAEVMTTDHPLKKAIQELQGRGHCDALPLGVLPEAAVAAYLRGRFGEVPPDFAKALHQRTDGNPLFMVATVEYLMREGIVVPDGAQWRITQDLPTLQMEVPENLRQLIATQLEGLRPEEQHLLDVASVAGAEFTVAILAAELNQAREVVEAQCAHLVTRRQFLRSAGIEQLADDTTSGRYGFVHALYQRVIYERISEARRMQLHCRMGERKEQLAGDHTAGLANELATHYETGGDYVRTVHYLALAGEAAIRRQAHHEAIRHLSKGLALLRTLPDTPERARQELSLQLALGIPLITLQGWVAPQVGQAYHRALDLSEHIGTTTQRFHALRGLELFYMTRTEYAKARQFAEQLLPLAQQLQDPALLVGAYMAMGQVRFFTGEFTPALEHFEHGIALTPQHYNYQSWSVGHPGISSLGYGAWALWFLGYPDQALQMSQEALRLAREEAHPFTLAMCLQFAAKLHQVRREAQATQSRAEENVALSMTHGFTPFVAMETHTRGWALAAQGHYDEGLALMRQTQDTWRAVGMNFGRTHFLATLAETCSAMGQFEEGVQAVTEALALVEQSGERQSEAELYRLRGELALAGTRGWGLGASSPPPQAPSLKSPVPNGVAEAVEADFRKALDIARHQHAKSLELRAAMSLARLWQNQGKGVDARELLQEVYDWFTEGFDTKDLQDAKTLLVMLGGTGESPKSKVPGPKGPGARGWGLGTGSSSPQAPSPKSHLSLLSPHPSVLSPLQCSAPKASTGQSYSKEPRPVSKILVACSTSPTCYSIQTKRSPPLRLRRMLLISTPVPLRQRV